MSIILPHAARPPQRHTTIPYLWRAACSCGWGALAGSRAHAIQATDSHLSEEEPFPSEYLFPNRKEPGDDRQP